MDTWGALSASVMTRDDLSIRRKTGIVSTIRTQFIEYTVIKTISTTQVQINRLRKKKRENLMRYKFFDVKESLFQSMIGEDIKMIGG